MPFYPDVPNVPGVPPLLRNPLAAAQSFLLPLLTQDAFGLPAQAPVQPWGIYDQNGFAVILADSCVSMDYRQEWVVADYQVEEGGFESYDKVAMPYEARVRMACGGSLDAREAFLQSIEQVAPTVELFDVVTPERVYLSANITHYDYRRTANQGLGLMQVDIALLEIRVTAEADFSQTQAPSGAGTKNDGTVQTTDPTPQQQSALSSLGL